MVKKAALFAAICSAVAGSFQIVNLIAVMSRKFQIPSFFYLVGYGMMNVSICTFMICLFVSLDKNRPRR